MENCTKILLKVLNINKNQVEWVHFCYIDQELYNKFLNEKNPQGEPMNATIARWCNEDFCVDLNMSSTTDVIMLREIVKDFYKRAHPDVYIDSKTDRQGWLRVWVTRKIKEELRIYD